MKTLKYHLFTVAFLALAFGCMKTDDDIQASLSVNPAQKNIEANPGNFKIAVASTVKWTASCDKNWLTLDPINGTSDGTIQVEYQANSSLDSRSATITIKGPNVEDKTIIVTQLGQPIFIIFPPNMLLPPEAGSLTINITTNLSWIVSSNQTWCTMAPSSGIGNTTLTINYQANKGNVRTAIIIFSANGVTDHIFQLTQAGFGP